MPKPAYALLLALVFLTLGAPLARADVEPNNNISEFEGPVAGGTEIAGKFQTLDDSDWYAFYASAQQQLSISVSAVGASCGWYASFRDTDGELIAYVYLDDNDTDTMTYTTPTTAGRYFLHFREACAGDSYKFRIDPAAAVVTGPSRVTPQNVQEPNEYAAQAWGPLLGGVTYRSGFETANDAEWFFFHTAPGEQQLDIAVTGLGSCGTIGELYAGGDVEGSVYVDYNEIEHIRFTSHKAETRVLRFRDGCVDDIFLVAIHPAAAVSSTPPPPPPEPTAPASPPDPGYETQPNPQPQPSGHCLAARREVSYRRDRVRRFTRRLRAAQSPGARRRARVRLRREKRKLSVALERRALHC
jgi:hypothetical protein